MVVVATMLAAGLGYAPSVDAAMLIKKQKADPQPVGRTCPDTWYYYKGKCIPYGRSWYGAPSYLYHYGPGGPVYPSPCRRRSLVLAAAL